MHVGRPEFFKIAVLIVLIPQRGDIVGERVDPHVNDVSLVKIDGNAPFEAGAGDAEIVETGLDEVVDHLIHTGLRLEEVGLGEQLFQTVGEFRQPEEIGFLGGVGDLPAAVGTLAVH